jgi:hypothetical protein
MDFPYTLRIVTVALQGLNDRAVKNGPALLRCRLVSYLLQNSCRVNIRVLRSLQRSSASATYIPLVSILGESMEGLLILDKAPCKTFARDMSESV